MRRAEVGAAEDVDLSILITRLAIYACCSR